MRGVFFCSIAFAVNTAVASVCKPRPRSSDTSTLLLPTSATQDVTTTTLLAVPPASTSAPVFSDAASTSLSEGIATTTDLSLSVTIDTTSEKTGVAIETTSSVDNVETPTLIDTATTRLPTTTANTLTTELSFTTLKEALSTEASIDVDTTVTIGVTTTEGEVTPTSVTIISADTTTATRLEEAVSSEAATANLTPTTLEATTTLDTTTTEVPTADETTTTAEAAATTSHDPWQPLPTFDLVGIGSPLSNSNGERLSKWDMTWEVIGWKSNEPALHMAIDPETSYLRESGSSYICVLVDRTEPEYHNRIVKCDVELLDMPIVRHLTCEQKSDGKLACSAPAVSCILSEATWEFECEDLEGEFDRFYTVSDGSVDLLAFGSERYPPPGTEVHPIELGVIAPRSEL